MDRCNLYQPDRYPREEQASSKNETDLQACIGSACLDRPRSRARGHKSHMEPHHLG
jgi:hypothetical protein